MSSPEHDLASRLGGAAQACLALGYGSELADLLKEAATIVAAANKTSNNQETLRRHVREADVAFAKLQSYLMKVAPHANHGDGIEDWAISVIEWLREALFTKVPTEAAVEAAAKVIAESSLIDAPRLPFQAWLGLARVVLESQYVKEER